MPENDMTLLEAYAEGGDAGAFAELVRRHTALVFHTCLRTLGDRQRAEDAAQETFYRLMREPRRVRRSVAGYLHQVATRLCLDVLRSESARGRRERSYGAALDADRRQRDRQWAEVAPHLDAALLELPEPTRRLLVEHFLEGRSQRAMAKEAGVSPATMCRRVELAMEALRGVMRNRGVSLTAAVVASVLSAEAAAAVPASLAMRLGKLSMLSGPKLAAPASPVVTAVKLAMAGGALAGLTGAAALLVVLAVALMPEPVHPRGAMDLDTTRHLTPTSTARPEPAVTGQATRYLVVAGDAATLDASQIQLVEVPAGQQSRLSVAFADGHVETLPAEEVAARVQRQTGHTLESLVGTAPRVQWP